MKDINIKTEIHAISDAFDVGKPFSLVHAGRVDSRVNESYKRNSYNRYTFELLTGGTGTVKVGEQEFIVQKGDLYVLPKGIDHEISPSAKNPWQKIFFSVRGPLVDNLINMYHLSDISLLRNFNKIELFQKIYHLSLNPCSNVHQKAILIFHELLIELDLFLNREKKSFSPLVQKIKGILDEHVELPLRLDDIGSLVHKTNVHVIRLFKKEMNITPYDYLLERRIHFSKFLLEETWMPIKQISRKLLFADEYYFSRYFKKKIGQTPFQYRKQFRH